MGARSSVPLRDKDKVKGEGKHTPVPDDTEPFQGKCLDCIVVSIPVQMKRHFVSNFIAGQPAVTSDVDTYYPTLARYQEQGYDLHTFYHIQGLAKTSGFREATVPYVAVFSKLLDVGLTKDVSRLFVEKCTMHVQFTSRVKRIFLPARVLNNEELLNKITLHSSMGARLLCIETNGQVVAQRMSGKIIGLDAIFEIPIEPTPSKYVYQMINVPIEISSKVGYPPKVTMRCDWLGTMTAHLNQGWKLVEIFLDQIEHQSGNFNVTATANSVWFFEKETSKLQDTTPVYEGTVIEYFHEVSTGFGSPTLKTDWSPFIIEMGQRGWELSCIQQSPELRRIGFGKFQIKFIMFFQRIISSSFDKSIAPPPYPGPSHPGSSPYSEPSSHPGPTSF